MNSGRPILLIEDDVVDQQAIERTIVKLGISNPLISFDNAEDLFSWLQQSKSFPLVILLDLNLPGMNGLEILKRLKKNNQYCVIPIVILTTSNDPNDRQECFRNGVAGYMTKTIDPKAYIDKIKLLIQYWSASELAY